MKIFAVLTIILKLTVLLLFLCFVQVMCNAQILKPAIFIETNLKTGIGENSPYYSVSNQHGIFSAEKNSLLLRTGVINNIDTTKRISLSYGLDAIFRNDSNNEIWVQQAFVRTKVYFIILQGGIVEETFGNQDNQLSSGAYLYSGNANPIPKIALYTNDFITIPYTNNLLEIKAYVAHGWFGKEDQYVKDAFLHQKFFYIRIGEKRFPLSVNLGIHHTAMWGGKSPRYGKIPANWAAYKSIFLGQMKGDLGPAQEQLNVLGNHLASYSLGFDYKLKDYIFKFYWQTILEDKNGRVGLDWKNKGDGLWGVVLENHRNNNGLQKIGLEFFNSTSQSGNPNKSGGDNYFNNYLYRSGWTYRNMTIGSPLITSPLLTGRGLETIDSTNIHQHDHLENNSIRAIVVGLLYKINAGQLTIKLTYSRNYGTIAQPYSSPHDQIYSAIDYSYPSKRYQNLLFSWQGAFDFGSHLGNNAGLMFKMRKSF